MRNYNMSSQKIIQKIYKKLYLQKNNLFIKKMKDYVNKIKVYRKNYKYKKIYLYKKIKDLVFK